MFLTSAWLHPLLPPTSPTFLDEEGDLDVHDRGMLYYRLLKKDVKEAERVVSGQIKTVAESNTVIPRVRITQCYPG